MAYIPPDPHLLSGMTHQDLPWWKALAELVDNAFDANAKRVTITFAKGRLIVHDDGDGIRDLLDVARLGKHSPHAKAGIGMHGIGAKDAWLSCSDTMEVESVCNGRKGRFRVDRNELAARRWECDDPTYEPCDFPSYTEFRFQLRKGKKKPTPPAFKRLAFTFTPAIRSGLQIVQSNGRKLVPLIPHELPPLRDPIRAEFDVNGKPVAIDIGILPDGESAGFHGEGRPFWVIYGHRVIMTTSMGAGEYSVQKVAGTITLGRGWRLSKNKEAISEPTDDLSDAIFDRIEPLMKRAHAMAETIASDAMKAELESMLNDAVSSASNNKKKASRDSPQNKTGRKEPKGSGRKCTNASKTQDGNGNIDDGDRSSRRRGFVLDYAEMEDKFGSFDRSGMRVTLNKSHPFVANALREGNRQSLVLCAFALIADHEVRHEGEYKLLKFDFGDFAGAFGSLAKSLDAKKPEGTKNAKTAG